MNYKPFLLTLLCITTIPTIPLTHKEELELRQQKEKDDQEYRMAILKVTAGFVTLILTALIHKYMNDK